jgi:hypothetical protein
LGFPKKFPGHEGAGKAYFLSKFRNIRALRFGVWSGAEKVLPKKRVADLKAPA